MIYVYVRGKAQKHLKKLVYNFTTQIEFKSST